MTTATQPMNVHNDFPTNVVAMRLAYLVSRFPKLTETFVLYEVTTMERLGFEVDLYSLQRHKTTVMHAEAERLMNQVHFASYLSMAVFAANMRVFLQRPWLYLQTLFTLLRANWGSLRYFVGAFAFYPKAVYFSRLMVRDGIDHIHAHFASHPAAMAFAIHRLTGIPYSFTAHGSDLHCDRHMLTEKVASSAFTVTISHYNRQLIRDETGAHTDTPVHVIHCGVNTDDFTVRSVRTDFENGCGPVKIACTGTLHEVKGQRFLVDACWQLHQRGYQIECHFMGDGPDRAMLENLVDSYAAKDTAKHTFRELIHFHGQLRQQELRHRLQTIDIVVTPSVPTRDGRREGIPVALMEAMASGVPAIASRLSGIPELINDGTTGLLVEPGDVDQLASALTRLIDDSSLRQSLARAARCKVEQEFELTSNAELLASEFRDSFKAHA